MTQAVANETAEVKTPSGSSSREGKSIRELYYITHIENLPSILDKGILSHQRIVSEGIKYTQIYDEQIVSNRREKRAPNGASLWAFANLYFQPSNPMLYRVTRQKPPEEVAILAIRRDVLNRQDIFLSDGNAASGNTKIQKVSKGLIQTIGKQIDTVWWAQVDGKRRSMAECLVPDEVPPEYIQAIYVSSHKVAEKVRELIPSSKLPVIPEPSRFFQSRTVVQLTPNLFILDGDMFFSGRHTLTISVNCVGVMGRGLASRAKYLFPDVYVYYQDLCKRRTLQLGKPALYRRESPLDYQLADEPSTLLNANTEAWFLLFPTKYHWRDRADLEGIEKGLAWIVNNYPQMGLKSLALPALGCGLGGLEWQHVGPMLCKHMSKLGIPVSIYLPAEKKIPEEYLSKDFLL